MDRRQFLSTIPGAMAALPALAAGDKKPNVLFLAIDDMNDWLGCLGGHPDVKTPNIDRLANRGTVFTNAHCQAPICGPSRASIMTGLLPSTTGIYGQINDAKLRQASAATETAPFLFEYFRDHGYQTMAIGKLFHQHVPNGTVDESGGRVAGFGPKPPQRFKWDAKKTSTDWGAFPDTDEEMPDYGTAQWSVERLRQRHEKPFLLAAGFLRPHVPWYVPQKWFDMYPADEIAMPPYLPNDYDDIPELGIELTEVPMMPTTEWARKNGEWKYIVQAYLACVTFVDHYVGEILKALEESEYADNTYVMLWGDHGYHIGEKNRFAKHSLWEEATRAPLLVAGPGFEGGQVCRKPVGMIDMYPTLLDLCGLPANELNEGHSFRPLLEDPESAEWQHAAITTYGRNNHAVRTEHFRYVRYEDGSEELYDHREDADEWRNLAGNPKFASLKERLKKHLPEVNAAWSPVAPYDFNEYLDKAYERQVAQ
jgi:arylsulfatase A-like enzyme